MSSVSDNFVRADGTLGSNWVTSSNGDGTIQLINHNYAPGTGNQTGFPTQLAAWNGGQPFGNDQWVTGQIAAIASVWSTVAITACAAAAGTSVYTYTLTSGAALQVNQEIIISGMTDGHNNGAVLITALGAGTFSALDADGANESGSSGVGVSPVDSICGLNTRMTADGQNTYLIFIGNNSSYVANGNGTVNDSRLYCREIWKRVSGTYTSLYFGGNFNPVPDSVNDVYIFGTLNDKLCIFKNNAILTSLTDSAVASGLPGLNVTSANAAGKTMPLGTNPQNSGTQWTNWTAKDLQLLPAGWKRLASDNMNAAAGNFSASWTAQNIYNNICKYSGTGLGRANAITTNSSGVWTGRVWANDQACTIVLYAAVAAATSVFAATRAATATQTFYAVQVTFTSGMGAGTLQIAKWVAGVRTGFASPVAVTLAFGDVIRLESVGTTHNCYQNGTLIQTATDGAIASGSPGILITGDTGNTNSILYWEGDEVATSNAATPTGSQAGAAISLATSTGGAYIYYTTDGSTPTTSSTLYQGPFNLASSATVKAIAVAGGFLTSATYSQAFTVASGNAGSMSLRRRRRRDVIS